jgi:phage baseplate assembly protein W
MAFDVKKINPLDLQPRKAIGVDLPFSGIAVFNSTYQTKDAVKANLINFVLTGQGERFLNPQFGLGITKFLFENITPESIEQAKYITREGITQYFPRIIINELNLNAYPDSNQLILQMRYSIRETGIQDELTINFEQ